MKTNVAVYRAVPEAVYWAVFQGVHRAVYLDVYWAVFQYAPKDVQDAVHWVVERIMYDAMCGDPPHPSLTDFLTAGDKGAP